LIIPGASYLCTHGKRLLGLRIVRLRTFGLSNVILFVYKGMLSSNPGIVVGHQTIQNSGANNTLAFNSNQTRKGRLPLGEHFPLRSQ